MDIDGYPEILRFYRLERHFDCDPLMLLVGEAPGYQGCHFSGVPFTNEKLILDGKIPRVHAPARITSRQRSFCEPSATIVWGALHDLGFADRVVMWNAFAWHPHKPGEPYSNRAPARAELQSGIPVLRAVLSHFSGVPIVPIGRVAESTLKLMGVEARPALRHPSMGGASQFRAGLTEIAEAMK